MFPETAFLHDPAMLWQFVAASCLQVVVIASLYLAVARIPARWVPWLRIATLAAFAAICIGSNALVIAPRLRHSGIRVFSGIGCGGQSHRDRCASPWPMAAMAGAEEKARNGSLNGYSPSTAGNQSP